MTAPPTITVTVPATTANLGCAFDCAAIAVSLHLRVSASIDAAPAVTYRGPDAESIPLDSGNLIVKSMYHYEARAGKTLPPARVDIENEIPLGVGLGSSAAAIVAGIALGAALCNAKIDAAETLRLALEIEGHPDNLAAAVHGGMVVSAVAGSDVLVLKTEVSPQLDFVCVIPDVPLPTEKARSILPAQYSRQDVVANLQRTALLSAAFFSGKDLQPEMFRDRLHQPHRAPLIPGIDYCLAYRHEGLAGVFLSGAGSAVMAIATSNAQQIGDALVAEFRKAGTTARALLLKADNCGTRLGSSSAGGRVLDGSDMRKLLDVLIRDTRAGKACLAILKGIDLNVSRFPAVPRVAPTFFAVARFAQLNTSLMHVSRLVDKHKDALSVLTLLNASERCPELLAHATPEAVLDLITRSRQRLDDHQSTLDSLRVIRDKVLAHTDKNVLKTDPGKYDELIETAIPQLESLYAAIGEVVNEISVAIDQVSVDFDALDLDDIDHLFRVLDLGQRAWQAGPA
jgi:homoserine kinase